MRPSLLAVPLLLVLAACGSSDPEGAASDAPPSGQDAAGQVVEGALRGPAGEDHGTVTLSFGPDATVVTVDARGLEPGVHGFHVHTTGACEPDSSPPGDPSRTGAFLSAGGHLAEDGQRHGDHLGDLPPLLVAADGTALLQATTDRLSETAVLDADGAAVMVHADADNFTNVPERYAPQLDDTTLSTGDAGGRVACAVLGG